MSTALKHSAEYGGKKVGHNVDVITSAAGVTPASRTEAPREVFIGCSPMEINKKLGPFMDITARAMSKVGITAPPNLTFHWAVIVGDYVHELNYDAHYYNTYENKAVKVVRDKLHRDEYRLYPVGTTCFNDAAIVEEGVKAIDAPHMLPLYEVRTNNCHKFVIELLTLICDPGRKKVTTSFQWNARQVQEELEPRLGAYAVPIDATDEEVAQIKAKAEAEHAERVAEFHARQEQKKAAALEAEKQAAMKDILDNAQELMTRSEVEQQIPEPLTAVTEDELVQVTVV